MKKVLLSLATVVALAFSANAQTEKGKVLFGGTLAFTSDKVEGAPKSDVTFSIVPSAGYFVSNNFAIGTGLGYVYEKSLGSVAPYGSAAEVNTIVVAPFARYYANLSDQFKFFTQLSVPLEFGSVKTVNPTNGDTGDKVGSATNIGVMLSPGFAFFPTKKVAIEVSVDGLSYRNEQFKPEVGSKSTNTNFGLRTSTFGPKLGVAFHF